jgi:hypothetical protein
MTTLTRSLLINGLARSMRGQLPWRDSGGGAETVTKRIHPGDVDESVDDRRYGN